MARAQGSRASLFTFANAISISRIVMAPLFVWALTSERKPAAILTLGAIGMSDWLDGFIARRMGQVGEVGKVLDPVADRVAVVGVALALILQGALTVPIGASIILRDVLVAGAFPLVENSGARGIPVSRTGKVATASLYAAFGLLLVSVLVSVSTALASATHVAGVVIAVGGSALYWLAAVRYLRQVRRRLGAKHEPASSA